MEDEEPNVINLSVTLAGINLELKVLKLTDSDGNKSLIVFQDTLTDSKENSEESKIVMKRLKRTFKIN